MESNKLVILESTLPLMAYPPKKLDETLETVFMFWLSNLLSLKADKEEIVLNALPEIKYHFHSLGLDKVKKAFEMYARGQLSIKPISNYFDIVLVGQIFKEYRAIKPKNKIKEVDISEEEKKNLMSSGMKKCLDHYSKTNLILEGYTNFLYDYFYDDNYLPKDNETKNKFIDDAKVCLQIEYLDKKPISREENHEIKNTLESLNDNKPVIVINKAKELIVMKFLRELLKDNSLLNEVKLKYNVN